MLFHLLPHDIVHEHHHVGSIGMSIAAIVNNTFFIVLSVFIITLVCCFGYKDTKYFGKSY
jgi:hypothetical protein